MRSNLLRLMAVVAGPVGYLLSFGGCGTLAGNPGDKPKPQAATSVAFSLTDAAIEDAKSVFVTIESLEVSLSGDGWVTIPLAAATEVDLLQYQSGKVTPLAALATLPIGTYSQTRLKLAATHPPRLITSDNTEHALTIPSGNETGLKITTPFTVESGTPLSMTIDFDLRKSIKVTGNGNGNGQGAGNQKYMMKPVLRLIRNDGTGVVTGKAVDNTTVCIYATGAAKDATNDCDQAESSAVAHDGAFTLAFIPAGSYELRLFPKDGTLADVAGVTVKAGETVDVGTVP